MLNTQRSMIAVAVVVCGFAVGMAALLNYFKYRSTSNRIVTDRLVVTGRSIETVIHLALDLGLQLSEINTLPATLERERDTDDLIRGIDIFDDDGKVLYSTDRSRTGRPVPPQWRAATASAHGSDWMIEDEGVSAAGMALKNSFGVTLAHLALRFSRESRSQENFEVARELALNALAVLAVAAAVASLALIRVMRGLTRDVADAEKALAGGAAALPAARGPFTTALRRFVGTTQAVEGEIAALGAELDRRART